jgi:hypothetical protein
VFLIGGDYEALEMKEVERWWRKGIVDNTPIANRNPCLVGGLLTLVEIFSPHNYGVFGRSTSNQILANSCRADCSRNGSQPETFDIECDSVILRAQMAFCNLETLGAETQHSIPYCRISVNNKWIRRLQLESLKKKIYIFY